MKASIAIFLLASSIGISPLVAQSEGYPTPPSGEIWGGHVDSVNAIRTDLGQVLSGVPAGEDGQASPWFSKLQTIKGQLDQVAVSKAQTDLFLLVPNLAEVFQKQEPLPFVISAFGPLANLGVSLVDSAGTHVAQQNGTVTAAVLASLIKLFAVGDGFISEASWEDRPMPLDAPGSLILNPAAVVLQLKSGPWKEAQQFLGYTSSATDFFSRYGSSGDGLSVLKTRYAADETTIHAKYLELKTWVEEQEQLAE